MCNFRQYWFHIQDPVPFRKSLKVTIEHKGARQMPDGQWNGYVERADDFSSVAYWYQTEPHVEFAKMPPVEERLYPSNSTVIEGESLIPSAEPSGPQLVVQQLWGWSGGSQLFYMSQSDKASLTLRFSVAKAGEYRLYLTPTRSFDYGIYDVFVDDRGTGKPTDLYSADVVQGPAISLGKHRLSAGEHSLRIQCVGKNQASKGYYFGLDFIELVEM